MFSSFYHKKKYESVMQTSLLTYDTSNKFIGVQYVANIFTCKKKLSRVLNIHAHTLKTHRLEQP